MESMLRHTFTTGAELDSIDTILKKIPLSRASDKTLQSYWEYLLSAYSSKREGKKHEWSFDKMIEVAKNIICELTDRGKTDFSPDEYNIFSRELFDKAHILATKAGYDVPLKLSPTSFRPRDFEVVGTGSIPLQSVSPLIVKRLTNRDLKGMDDFLHEILRGYPKPVQVVNAHQIVLAELCDRGLAHVDKQDDLDNRTDYFVKVIRLEQMGEELKNWLDKLVVAVLAEEIDTQTELLQRLPRSINENEQRLLVKTVTPFLIPNEVRQLSSLPKGSTSSKKIAEAIKLLGAYKNDYKSKTGDLKFSRNLPSAVTYKYGTVLIDRDQFLSLDPVDIAKSFVHDVICAGQEDELGVVIRDNDLSKVRQAFDMKIVEETKACEDTIKWITTIVKDGIISKVRGLNTVKQEVLDYQFTKNVLEAFRKARITKASLF